MLRFASFALLALLLVLVLSPTLTQPSTAITLSSVATAADADPAEAAAGDDADVEDFGDDDDDDDGVDVEDDDDDDDLDDEGDEGDDAADDAGAASDNADKPTVLDPPGEENASYKAPDATDFAFLDTFQSGLDKWTHTSVADYNGRFAIGQGAKPTLKGDRSLIIPEKARKYGLSTKVDGLDDLSDKTLVLQYELKLEQGMTCGGAYIKLPLADFDVTSFDGSTPYSIMFGPDKCGATDKVHFIFQSKNPVTGERKEHHLKSPPTVANSYDKKTHLYTLVVKEDGKFEIFIDHEQRSHGTLKDDFTPPVQPEKEIDDPEDKKPETWVDTAKIPDPDATKPDDWDEDAPAQIVDEEATKPEGWLDDEPEKIADPEAKKPDEWNDEEDGDWEAPKIANPKCEEVGCGEWKRPMKANPDYKGKWKAPLIDNPDYIGEWKPKKIPNPEYYEVTKEALLGVGGLGFEIWTMDQAVLFDNVWLGTNAEAAQEFANKTFSIKQKTELDNEEKERKETEKKSKKKDKGESKSRSAGGEKKTSLGPVMDRIEEVVERIESALQPVEDMLAKAGFEPMLDKMIDMGIQKPMLLVVSVPILITLLFIIALSGGKKAPQPASSSATAEERSAATSAAETKKTDATTEDDAAADGETDGAVEAEAAGEDAVTDAGEKTGIKKRSVATAQ